MEKGIFTIDGVDLRLWVTGIKRSFAVTDSEHSGRLQNYEMYRDVIGTFYNYALTVQPHPDYRADYNMFYNIITAATSFHTVVFPFGDETLEFAAYVTSGDDDYDCVTEIDRWDGLSIQFIAKEPQRRP